jgi:nuclear pore complex protein Nup107
MGFTTIAHAVRVHFIHVELFSIFRNSARKTEPLPVPSPRELLASNPYTTPSTLAQSIMNASQLLTELVVVREWLHETAPQPQDPGAVTGYWKFTKHSIMQALRTGIANRDGTVREMDPDAPLREEGKTLAADDAVSRYV